MFCPQCGAQAEQPTNFCKSCGLKLAEHARLLADPKELARANKEESYLRQGMGALLGSVMAYVLFGIICGGVLVFQPNVFQSDRLAAWIIMLLFPLLPGLLGIFNLVRGGYFRDFEARKLQAQIERLDQQRQALEARKTETARALNAPQPVHKAASVTEHTTRELQPVSITQRSIKGES
jgi:hypothetical protein